MSEYAVVINFALDNINQQSIVLDTINDVRINDTSTITEHPIVSGDMIADHMIRNPITMSITGSLSTNGSTLSSILVDDSGLNLLKSQEIFTEIKNKGIFCDIYKISLVNKDIRFMRRNNMVLQSITWTERINVVDFSFEFRQVLVTEVQNYYADIDDEFLPSINFPKTSSFFETLIPWDDVDKAVHEVAIDTELITHEFEVGLASMGKDGLIGLGIGIAIASVLVKLGVIAATGPAGWIIAGVALLVGGIVGFIAGLIKSSKYRIAQFKYYEDESKWHKEVKRYGDFVGEIHNQMKQLDTQFAVYQVQESGNQEIYLSIDNTYYKFKFNKNNVSGKYSLDIETMDDSPVGKSLTDITGALTNFGQCTEQNAILEGQDGSRAYLVCPFDDEQSRNDLTNYYLLVSGVNPDQFNEEIRKIIKNAILY